MTVPVLGFGIKPRGPSARPNFPTTGIISGVAMAISKLKFPFSTSSAKSLSPTMSAPASLACNAASPCANTATRTFRPVPDGRATVPRTISSALRGSTPSRQTNSIVSSNFAVANCLDIATASFGAKLASRSKV